MQCFGEIYDVITIQECISSLVATSVNGFTNSFFIVDVFLHNRMNKTINILSQDTSRRKGFHMPFVYYKRENVCQHI